MHLNVGTLLQGGKYRIEKVLGQGGFGITYLAVQTNLKNRKVAIKEFFLKEHCERDSSTSHVSMGTSGSRDLVQKFKDKFVKEAEIISEFRNHHIITIHDVFEENGTAYYVMEFLAGGSLKDRIPAEGLSESESLGYVRQICEALAYIHENNILHLDIKPSNILFRKEDEAVLIDFGISKHYDEAGGGQTSTTPVGVSRGYAPLEQNKQGGVSQFSPATDIYALGATLYALLTGQTPPDADEVNEDGLPPLPQRVSASVSNAVEKAMSPKRKARPQSIAEFMELLDTASAPVEIPAEASDDVVGEVPVVKTGEEEETLLPPEPPQPDLKPRSMKWPWILLYLIVGIVLVFILLLFFNDRPESSSSPSVDVPVSQIPVGASYKDGFLRVNGIEYPMVYVSGGSFDMGATSEQGSDADSDEQTVHRVTLSSYRIGKYEVTQELWEAVMGSNPSHFKGARHPVEMVSWDDCQRFINKLNELTGQNFRLPTEAEWEFAARDGNSSRGYKYSGSNNVDNVAWYSGNSGYTTHNVGTKSPNELGVYDMSGNVCEWCSDWYGEYSSASQTNPKGPGSGSNRVDRGGSWSNIARNSRVSIRYYSTPDNRYANLGFRLCL